MSESKRTEGPWRLSHEADGTYIRSASGGLIARMESGSQPMRDANGVVIAAAPDLLAVVERCAAHFEGTDAPLGIAARAALSRVRP